MLLVLMVVKRATVWGLPTHSWSRIDPVCKLLSDPLPFMKEESRGEEKPQEQIILSCVHRGAERVFINLFSYVDMRKYCWIHKIKFLLLTVAPLLWLSKWYSTLDSIVKSHTRRSLAESDWLSSAPNNSDFLHIYQPFHSPPFEPELLFSYLPTSEATRGHLHSPWICFVVLWMRLPGLKAHKSIV